MGIVIAILLLLILWVLAPEVVAAICKIAAGLGILAIMGFGVLVLVLSNV